MAAIDDLLSGNQRYVMGGGPAPTEGGAPIRHVAVLTCMDARIDPAAAFGISIGDAHVLRNAGARVTDDVLRSLALSTHVLGVTEVLVVQHTKCGLLGASDDDLRQQTGADVDFLSIHDHAADLEHDVDLLMSTPFLSKLEGAAGGVYDVATGQVEVLLRRER